MTSGPASPERTPKPEDDFGAQLRDLFSGRFFVSAWRGFDEERGPPGPGAMHEAAITLLVAIVTLTVMEYAGDNRSLRALLAFCEGPLPAGLGLEARLRLSGYWEVASLSYWCVSRIVGFGLVPLIAVTLARRGRAGLALGTRGLSEHAWIYGLGFAIVLACVLVVARRPEFYEYYPFDTQANRSWAELLSWELLYALQFLALEVFFRGYLLEGTRRAFGSGAIFVAMVPYVMIHFGKPMSETFGAIVAGLFLGTLAMKTRSIWLGFTLHVAVAWSMDLLALVPTRGWPTVFFPTDLP